MSEREDWLPTEQNVEDYLLYSKMLDSLAVEVRELSKKKQDGVLNLTKVRMLNRVLKPLKEELLASVPAEKFLDLLDEDDIPNNSDAVLIISQYEAAIAEFRSVYRRTIRLDTFNTRQYWATVENPDGMGEEDEEDEEDEYEEDDVEVED